MGNLSLVEPKPTVCAQPGCWVMGRVRMEFGTPDGVASIWFCDRHATVAEPWRDYEVTREKEAVKS